MGQRRDDTHLVIMQSCTSMQSQRVNLQFHMSTHPHDALLTFIMEAFPLLLTLCGGTQQCNSATVRYTHMRRRKQMQVPEEHRQTGVHSVVHSVVHSAPTHMGGWACAEQERAQLAGSCARATTNWTAGGATASGQGPDRSQTCFRGACCLLCVLVPGCCDCWA